MKLTKNQVDKLNIELTVHVEAADYAENERKKLAEYRRNADFKGFRKGNVPVSLIQRVYGGQILADSVNQVIGEALGKFIEDEKLNILGEPLGSEKQPEIDWQSGNDFDFVFDIALSPEVEVDVVKEDTVFNYTITVSAKEKENMASSLKKYYEERKEEKTDEEIEKEVAERFEASNKDEAAWRLNKDIRAFYVEKAGIELPEAFLKRWLLHANEGKVTEEQVESQSQEIINRIESLRRFQEAEVVLLYYPVDHEVNLKPLIEKYWHTKTILLPVSHRYSMELRPYRGKELMRRGRYSIPEPLPEEYKGKIDLMIIPGVAFDQNGNRLGRGRGYYDTFLRKHPSVYSIGVCYDSQYRHKKEIPHSYRDKPVRCVITPTKTIGE